MRSLGFSPLRAYWRSTSIAAAILSLAAPHGGFAQDPLRPFLGWRTIETAHFAFHYPPELGEWTRDVASRIESVDSAVALIVGFAPNHRVQIVVDDPYDLSNGSALPFLDRPVIEFWATPPGPREEIGDYPTWGEILSVHEFAHIAHLARPSRNPLLRGLSAALPIKLGPIPWAAPRWVIEGYATYIEGRLTGSGRPYNAWRPTVLRQWAIEGRLPTYAQLSAWGAFDGGSFAYLAGSAYLEWLASGAAGGLGTSDVGSVGKGGTRLRGGDSSLVDVWRRLTARTRRSFDAAFAGVYGDGPDVLYGRFAAALTGRALAAERSLASAGIVSGDLIQHLTWATGDPAISLDGRRIAIVLRSGSAPSRVVIWKTTGEPDTTSVRAGAELLRRDPEDVPARHIFPAPKRPVATLLASHGRAFEDPRFLADGRHLLLWRRAPRPDGTVRPDLYLWDSERGTVRRVTRGAALREADPWPDGRSAAAVRCGGGHCDLVRVDLADGSVTTLARGSPMRSFYRPRVAPDGLTLAVSVEAANRWRVAIVDPASRDASLRYVDPDDGENRYDATFLSAHRLVVVSERGGIPNLESLDLEPPRGAVVHTITRVTGAAVAPEPNRADGSIWFLSLHARGFDLRRFPSAATPADSVVPLDPRLTPAVRQKSDTARGFARRPVTEPRAYGLGPRTTRWFPTPNFGPDGASATLTGVNSDVVERLELLLSGSVGSVATWRGGALAGAWRGFRPTLEAALFDARQSPSRTRAFLPGTDSLDVGLMGGLLAASREETRDGSWYGYRFGGSLSRLELIPGARARRARRDFAFLRVAAGADQTVHGWRVTEQLVAWGTEGETEGVAYRRGLATGGISTGGPTVLPVAIRVGEGWVSHNAPAFEQFALGGLPSTLLDQALLSQRIDMPALPTGVAIGDRLLALRAAVPISLLTPYYQATSIHRAGLSRYDVWHRLFGIEASIVVPPIPTVGTPAGRAVAGVARSLDAPFAKTTRGYFTVVLWP